VTIGLPVWNGQNYLAEALDSLLGQDFTDFEVIISDNGSDDQTESISRGYAEKDSRVHYHKFDENQGAARNYNRVFELARGKYFKWAAHDDVCLPSMLRRCVEVFEDAPESVVLVYGKAQIIDGDGRASREDSTILDLRQRRPHRRLARLLGGLSLATPVFGLFRSDALLKTRLIDTYVGSDQVLLADLAMLGQIWEIPEVLFKRRIHPGTSRRANRTKKDATAWFDPERAKRRDFLSIKNRLLVEYLRVAYHHPLPFIEKILCLMVIPTVVCWTRFRNWGGLQKSKLKALFSGQVKGASPKA